MNHNQLVAAIARRLYHRTAHDVAEVLDVLVDILREELSHENGYVYLRDIGRLYVQRQQLRSAGVVREQMQERYALPPEHLVRIYFRFRPAESLKQLVNEKRTLDEQR